MKNEDKLFHVIRTSGTFVSGHDSLRDAGQITQILNRDAQDNGRSNRYLAIPKPDTPQEEP